MNIFEAVKQSVTTRQAAEHYGIRVNRNGMVCCLFHKDRTPSMTVDERYYCFGCGVTGDVIDFVASFYNLGKWDAAVKLVQDFGIDYDVERHKKITAPAKRTIPKLSFEQRYEQAKQGVFEYCWIIMVCLDVGKNCMLRKWRIKIGIRYSEKHYRKVHI